jgi:phosphoribosyl-dephospho-CoA transferase
MEFGIPILLTAQSSRTASLQPQQPMTKMNEAVALHETVELTGPMKENTMKMQIMDAAI